MAEGLLVLFYSEDGRANWVPVAQADAPDWVKRPEVLGRLVGGEVACDPSTGDIGWWRAEKFDSSDEVKH